jgi:transcriptional regulator with XRE-family HTH domain
LINNTTRFKLIELIITLQTRNWHFKTKNMKSRIGLNLLKIREQKKLTQTAMAEILQIPPSTYAHYERNETSVDLENIVSFAEKLAVPVQELMPETLAITNNNHNSGNGGGIIFGNQYYYISGNEITNQVLKENQDLRSRIEFLETQIKKG